MLLSAPTEVFWCVTNQCNLNCRFCLSSSTRFKQADELTPQQREFVLQELIDNKILKVYLTGGEPMLCPELMFFIKQLRKSGIFIELTTNATLLNEEKICRLIDYDTNRVQISLNGANEETNDLLMGNSYRKIWKNLALLQKHGLRTHVKVTVVSQNIFEIPALVQKLTHIGINHIDISEVHPLGRAFENWQLLKVEPDELTLLRETIMELQRKTGISLSFHSPTLQLLEDRIPARCSAGQSDASSCQILSDGNVIPCAFALVWDVKNNIMDGGLRECWQGLKKYQLFQNPDLLQGKCATCYKKADCAGGCRAIAYLFSGEIWGDYPFCPLTKENVHYEQQEKVAAA